jgi:hypothetical protein
MRLTTNVLFRFGRATISAITLVAALTPTVAAQSSRWKEIGKTSKGNIVYVDPKSVKKAGGITTARIRVKFIEPVQQPKGPAWLQSQHVAMFDCAKKTIAAKETIYYADEAGKKPVYRTAAKIPGYGPAIGGSMTAVAMDYICRLGSES